MSPADSACLSSWVVPAGERPEFLGLGLLSAGLRVLQRQVGGLAVRSGPAPAVMTMPDARPDDCREAVSL